MFDKILIANRNEIACRVVRTAKKMGIRCVAIYSDADKNALHVKMADEAYYVGPSPVIESYLRGDVIIEIAKRCGANAIHPGYGFLSENPDFAAACAKANISFIGPPEDAIRAMGSKSAAKKIMEKAGIPLISGYHGDDQSLTTLKKAASKIGYPILLKAASGGGGKGMRVVEEESDFANAYTAAKREASSSFGEDSLLLEKYLRKPRHVEVQVFADTHGNCISLFDRDCSIQRRHQKIIEEAPAPNISDKIRKSMSTAAIKAAQAIQYVGAGTIEFLLDEDEQFYFMEMNTRLQVEHPVTEMITGLDLVEWQLRIAMGEKLPLKQEDIKCHGHAFEARIYAEDPSNQFLPATGKLHYLRMPEEDEHVRIDSGVTTGNDISIYYDPLIAKLIVWDQTREQALKQLQRALSQIKIVGVITNTDFLQRIADNQHFARVKIETGFIPRYHDELFKSFINNSEQSIALTCLYVLLKQQHQTKKYALNSTDRFSPWFSLQNWRVNLPSEQTLIFLHHQQQMNVRIQFRDNYYELAIDKNIYRAFGELQNEHELIATINDQIIHASIVEYQNRYHLFYNRMHEQLELFNPALQVTHEEEMTGHLNAPMPGTVVAIMIKPGTLVDRSTSLLVIEAMKMEHTIYAPARGKVTAIHYQIGDKVDEGAELLEFVAES